MIAVGAVGSTVVTIRKWSIEMTCQHDHVRSTDFSDYCEDCGAVRLKRAGRDGLRRPESWHVCDLCRLPGVEVEH
jgi:hypothetical protein